MKIHRLENADQKLIVKRNELANKSEDVSTKANCSKKYVQAKR